MSAKRMGWILTLATFCAVGLCASDKPKKDDAGALTLKVIRPVGKALLYEGTVFREQRGTNSYTDKSDFYLQVANVANRDGMDLVCTQVFETDRERIEIAENGKRRELTALPRKNEMLDLGPNFETVGVMKCYAHTPQNGVAYRTDQLLTLKKDQQAVQVRGQTIQESDDKIVFMTETDTLDIPKSSITNAETIEKAHIVIGETPHFLFSIFSSKPVSVGDSWRHRVPVLIPQQAGLGHRGILPTQFTALLTSRLRDVRNGIATVEYQVSGEFDSQGQDFRTRFPDTFHQNNRVMHKMSGSGTLTLDIEKGRLLTKEESFSVTMHYSSVISQPGGEAPKTKEDTAEITSKFSLRLLPPGTRMKTNMVVPDYETGEQIVTTPLEEQKDKKKDEKKKKK